MRLLLTILILSSLPSFAWSQIDSAQIAGKVIDSLNVNSLPPDSAAIAKSLKAKASKALADSLNNYDLPVQLDSTLLDQAGEKAKNRLDQEFTVNIPTDSATLADKAESIVSETITDQTGIQVNGIPTDSASMRSAAKSIAQEEFTNQTSIEAPDITIDSTFKDQVKEEVSKRGEEAIKNTDEFKALSDSDAELGQLTDMKEEIEVTREQLQQMQAKKEMKQKMATRAKDFISEHSEELQEVQSQMTELKQKYAAVPNSNDLSTAQKRSSLQGESFWKRLVIGGNFNLTETNPVSIDFSPVLGWKFNKLFELGVTGTYRARFGADKSGINTFESEDVYGYSAYANHMAFKNFFGYIEFENISQVTGTDEDKSRDWHQNLLVGIGQKFMVAKFLEMQAIISYNFLHDNRDGVYNSPVVFKTGLRVVR